MIKPAPPTPALTFYKRIAFTLIIIVLAIAVVEAALILLEPFIFPTLYVYDPDLGFKIRPGAMNSNRFGFCDRDYPLEKEPGTYRILFLNDSFGWTGGPEGNFTALLENTFVNHYGGHKVDIINSGYPMTHPGELFGILRKFGLRYRPDLVVLGFFAGNDFTDADPHRKRVVVNGVFLDIDTHQERELRFLGLTIVKKSRILLILKQKFPALVKLIIPSELREDDEIVIMQKDFLKIKKGIMDFNNLNIYRRGYFQENIKYVFNTIREMNNLLRKEGILLIVAMYPEAFQVDEKLRVNIFRTFQLRPEDYNIELQQDLLKDFLAREDIPWVDLLGGFREKAKEEKLYYESDVHWNPAGIALAADILFSRLSPLTDSALGK